MAETRRTRGAARIALASTGSALRIAAGTRTAEERRTRTRARIGIGVAIREIGVAIRATVAGTRDKTRVRVATGASTVVRTGTGRKSASGHKSATATKTRDRRTAVRTAKIVTRTGKIAEILRGIKGADGGSAGADRLPLTGPLEDR